VKSSDNRKPWIGGNDGEKVILRAINKTAVRGSETLQEKCLSKDSKVLIGKSNVLNNMTFKTIINSFR
jgi:hypothetical protein